MMDGGVRLKPSYSIFISTTRYRYRYKYLYEYCFYFFFNYSNDVSCEFGEFRVDTHLRKQAAYYYCASCVLHRSPVFNKFHESGPNNMRLHCILIKIKIHSSSCCEIEDRCCRNSYLQAVCDTPIARITGCVPSLRI